MKENNSKPRFNGFPKQPSFTPKFPKNTSKPHGLTPEFPKETIPKPNNPNGFKPTKKFNEK